MATALGPAELIKKPGNLLAFQQLSSDQPPLVIAFWKYLLLCFETPRPSTDFKEPNVPARLDPIKAALKKAATALGAQTLEDDAGNLIIRKKGCGEGSGKPWLCLQGHLDMVCSQNEGVGHDFEKDGIEVRFTDDDGQSNGWLKPLKATTLGADNGVALAAGLAVMETVSNHPPLELLCTANEETDFSGATGLKPGVLKSKRLLNLDSEEDYSICVGCAGGFEHKYKLPVEYSFENTLDMVAVSVSVTGLHGGHSGTDIDKEYGNAIKLLARLMLQSHEDDQRLVDFQGGTGPSAIPREASCIMLVKVVKLEVYLAGIQQHFTKVKAEFESIDPGIHLTVNICPHDDITQSVPRPNRLMVKSWRCSRCPKCQAAEIAAQAVPTPVSFLSDSCMETKRQRVQPQGLSPSSTIKVLHFCTQVPNGVLRRSTEVQGLVESSVGFGVAELKDGHFFCHLFLRSSVNSYLPYGQKLLSSLGDLAGAENNENINAFPAWQPCLNSPLLAVMKKTHVELFDGKEPRVYAIHAGLEPGSLKEVEPDLDCCSIGPLIVNAHSPDERVHIASAGRFVNWLKLILETLANET